MTKIGRTRRGIWDRYAASDPGLLRLVAGLRTVGAVAVTLLALRMLGIGVTELVAGALAAAVATIAIRDRRVSDQALTLGLALPASLLSVTLGSVLNPHIVAGDIFFVLLIFAAAYLRRFGDRGGAVGLVTFQSYFLSLFVHATVSKLPGLYLAVAIAFAGSAIMRFALIPESPERTLGRLSLAFRARTGQLIATQLDVLEAEPDRLEGLVADLRKDTARLHETALMIQTRLDDGSVDEATASILQRRVADAEIAAERLGVQVLGTRTETRGPTLLLHLPQERAAEPGWRPRDQDGELRVLHDEVRALYGQVTRAGDEDGGAGTGLVRDRLLAYRAEENVPRAAPAVQEAFRAIGETTRAVLALGTALAGPGDESGDAPETVRSREEFEAEDVSLAGEAAAEPTGLDRATTRVAIQVAVGSSLAIVGGEFLSSQRWYWAVLTCWVVFLNSLSRGEILIRGYRRLTGTMAGVLAGVLLAGAVGRHTWTAFALVLALIFAMFFTAALSFTLTSFFVTAMLGLLYSLLHTYSLSVLLLRVEETALGAACGIIAALFVLPVRTDLHTDELLVTALTKLRDVTTSAVGQLSGAPPVDLLDLARELDTALDELRTSTRPLTYPFTPLRVRRRTVRYLVALLETCAYHTRSLAATAELVPYSRSIAADPRLEAVGRRISHNIDVLIASVQQEERGEEPTGGIETGPSIASMLEDSGSAARSGSVTHRVLRHLQRLDEAVVGLARPLGARLLDGSARRARNSA
ncbi:FUSC family protein [Streptomyces sp. NBC_01190]|uniref:FUSC family protein n=1 Tax=Streptomyces sp. NBC_01190 TaxID=2903767 RepID=UPI0038659423|nr:FUSC family protein [Streptomyces sp. NBC_01190]